MKGRARRAWRGLNRMIKDASRYPDATHDGLAGSKRQHASISVTVAGGIAGIRKSGSVTKDDARWAEAVRLLSELDLPESPPELSMPMRMDGLVYVFLVDGTSHVLADWQLTPALERLAALVLDV